MSEESCYLHFVCMRLRIEGFINEEQGKIDSDQNLPLSHVIRGEIILSDELIIT